MVQMVNSGWVWLCYLPGTVAAQATWLGLAVLPVGFLVQTLQTGHSKGRGYASPCWLYKVKSLPFIVTLDCNGASGLTWLN